MEVSQGSLVIVGANTPDCEVFWNGTRIQGIVALTTQFDEDDCRVVIKVKEDPILADMQRAGVIVRRVS